MHTETIPGLEARIKYAMSCVFDPIDDLESKFLSWEAANDAFAVGAIFPERPDVPLLLADIPWLAQVFRQGQVELKNEFGFGFEGRWIRHDQVCCRCKCHDASDGVCASCEPLIRSEMLNALFEVVDECWNDYSLLDVEPTTIEEENNDLC